LSSLIEGKKTMWKSLDLKSLVIGGLTVFLVVCAMGDWPTTPTTVVSPDLHGRFTIALASGAYGGVHAYVLDTATGEVWTPDRPGVSGEFYIPKLVPGEPNDPVVSQRSRPSPLAP
jgi:hypothetical protein